MRLSLLEISQLYSITLPSKKSSLSRYDDVFKVIWKLVLIDNYSKHQGMKASIRFVHSTILILGKIAKLIFILVLTISCKNTEPAFIVRGDKMVTKDVKVNIVMLKDKSTTIATTYYNGKSYEIKNQGTLRYLIYVSYQDSLFYKFEMDNLHGEVKGEPLNEIIIRRKEDGAIWVAYRALKENYDAVGTALEPWNKLVSEQLYIAVAKEKFTAFYKAK